MASTTYDAERKRSRVRFTAPDNSIRCLTVRQGKKETKKGLEKRVHTLSDNLEKLIECRSTGKTLDSSLLKWIDGLKFRHRTTLIECNLIDDDTPQTDPGLLAFFRQWLKNRSADKTSTHIVHQRAFNHLSAYFSEDTLLVNVTEYDADNYSRFLRREQELAESTARKMVSVAKQVLRSAVKARLISQNPFAEEKTTPPEKSAEKQYHVSDAEVKAIYNVCPSTEWQAFLILGRYVGLRLPSEIKALEWNHINWKVGVFTVHSPKLEHLQNGGVRQVPLFPQVKAILQKLWSENPDKFVLPHVRKLQNPNPSFRTIIKNSGIIPWPDLLYNLRQSAVNDAEHNPRFTSKNVTDWFGNSEKTRQKHYSRTLAEDVEAATEGDGRDLAWMDKNDLVHDLSMKATEMVGKGESANEETPGNSRVFSGVRPGSENQGGLVRT